VYYLFCKFQSLKKYTQKMKKGCHIQGKAAPTKRNAAGINYEQPGELFRKIYGFGQSDKVIDVEWFEKTPALGGHIIESHPSAEFE
jgi:hypothetical protein